MHVLALFFHHGDGCTLRIMRKRPANWVIAALLMVQLAIGLQWQMAQADAATPDQQMSSAQAGHCPTHQAKDSRTDASTPTRSLSSHNSPAPKHDCCHSLGCQCHCAQSPGVLDLPLASTALSFSFLLPVFDIRHPVTRTNEFFRPPIA
jgi:hypothetical protein